MKELTGKLAKNIDKIIQQIKESIIYIGLSLFISSIFYYIALGIESVLKRYKERQVNLGSEAARKSLAKEIEAVLLYDLKGKDE